MTGTFKWIGPTLLIGLGATALPGAQPVTIQSQSGQFFVEGIPVGHSTQAAPAGQPDNRLQLDPALLAVSCEKIKRALLDLLKLRDQWQSTILLQIQPGTLPEDVIVVGSIRFLDGWRYQLAIPERVERDRLLKTIVGVLLMDIAQRRSTQPVELPPWLDEGLAAMLQSGSHGLLTLEPYTVTVQHQQTRDPLHAVRQRLQATPPLTLEELSWPSAEQRVGKAGEVYESCAHLFVHELLRLKKGRECLQKMLRLLPEHLNWQTAFLRSFARYFPRIIDLDKWWSLTVVHSVGHDLSYTWSLAESCQKLEDILLLPVEVRLDSDELPMNTRGRLQSLVQEWDLQRQEPILILKLNHLNALRLRVARELLVMVAGYQQVLGGYLERCNRVGPGRTGGDSPHPDYQLLVRETVRRLDELDGQRLALQRLLEIASVTRHPANPPADREP